MDAVRGRRGAVARGLWRRLAAALVPDEWTTSVDAIDLRRLGRGGIRCLLVDIDNTLVAWGASGPQALEEARRFVERCRLEGLSVVLVSNARAARRRWVAAELGVPVVGGPKPRRAAFLRALRLAGCQPHEAAVVGDQLWTDVFGGRRAGMYTILVQPLSPREHLGTRLGRMAERAVLGLLARAGELPEALVRARRSRCVRGT